MQKPVTESNSALFLLVNNEAALQAAERLARTIDSGVRFSCEHQQKLTLAQGRIRDLHNAARKARFQNNDAACAPDAVSLVAPTASATEADEADDLLEFERDADDVDVQALFDQSDEDAIDDDDSAMIGACEFELELA